MFTRTKVDIKRYESSVRKYEEEEIRQDMVLFYGDSAFTRWQPAWNNRPLEEMVLSREGKKAAVNHGIGGSTAEELLYYYDRLVRPWKPRALVLEAYSNDRGFAYDPEEIVFLESRILEYARRDFSDIALYVCDARPLKKDLSMPGLYSAHREFYNSHLRDYCRNNRDVTLICHTDAPELYNKNEDAGSYETIDTSIFIPDEVHYNAEGYERYAKMFQRVLKDIL